MPSTIDTLITSGFGFLSDVFGKKTQSISSSTTTPVPTSSGTNTLLYIGIGGGVLLLFTILMMRK